MPEVRRRDFDLSLELVTPPVSGDAYRVIPDRLYWDQDGTTLAYDAYLPASIGAPVPVVVFVHGDGPPEFLQEPRRWGQYRSWAALAAVNGMAAITFDHASSEGRSRIAAVVRQIRQMLATVQREAGELGIDPRCVAVWSGSAGVPFGFVAALEHPEVRCQVAFYGPMDLRTDDSRNAPDTDLRMLADTSPITHLDRRRGAIQPLLIAKAGLDRPGINASIDAFVARAAQLGAPVTLEVHAEGRHGFDILDDDERSREIIGLSVAFMRDHLFGGGEA